jgi:hypothetical protein
MKVHLAGICCSQSYGWYKEVGLYPKFILESFYYLEPWLCSFPTFNPENFLLDSGAFTFMSQKKAVKTDWDAYVERYAETVLKLNIKYFFELDIDSIVGLKEVERLREKLERLTGKKCIPVWHKSRGEQYWLDMVANYDYVAIGGIVSKEIRGREHKYFDWFLARAREKKAKVHGLGFTNLKGLEKYKFYSVDSTSWIASRYALLYRFTGSTLKQIKRPENSRMIHHSLFDKHNLNE